MFCNDADGNPLKIGDRVDLWLLLDEVGKYDKVKKANVEIIGIGPMNSSPGQETMIWCKDVCGAWSPRWAIKTRVM